MSFEKKTVREIKLVPDSTKQAETEQKNIKADISTYTQQIFDTTTKMGYTEYIVMANGFIIAHFVDETSMASFLGYLKQYGLSKYPKAIMEIIGGRQL